MPERYSDNKPENKNKRPIPDIVWNNKSEESWTKGGFPSDVPYQISAPANRKRLFLSEVDTRQGPIERTVTLMVRLKATDWNTPKRERREYLYYMEEWEGKNWLGIPLNKVVEHEEGRYTEVVTRPVFNETNGDHIENKLSGTRTVYYIPFSKAKVDEIIANSAHSSKDHGIRFVIKFAMEDSPNASFASSRQQYSHDQFVNWTWDELRAHQYRPHDKLDDFTRPKTANTLQFAPS